MRFLRGGGHLLRPCFQLSWYVKNRKTSVFVTRVLNALYSVLADADGSEIERILQSLCRDLPGSKKSNHHHKRFFQNTEKQETLNDEMYGGSTDTLTDIPVRANIPGSFRKKDRRQSVFQSISNLFHK